MDRWTEAERRELLQVSRRLTDVDHAMEVAEAKGSPAQQELREMREEIVQDFETRLTRIVQAHLGR